ncbi:hypothetical protein [Moorena sp. SIO3I6]|uniref:hypothetical protein n=1 Tax=Moorena sp. SIO3I6 TaxID=2607831 RepID=UPI0013FBD6DE|nr:hypothetical protein [Moorena sp. SIO3I6]NEP26035.1 hypothetical protein [Moorena sp. SIO3I6]
MELPSSVNRALAIAGEYQPQAIERARAAIALLLGFRAHSEAMAYVDSPLTMSGFPVEIAFSSADSSFRYTIDPGPMEHGPMARLDDAEVLFARLGSPPLATYVIDLVRQFQTGHNLRYGVFIGGRHNEMSDRYKLYLEVPESAAKAAEKFATELLDRPRALPNRQQRIEMIGVDPYANRIEVYARIEHMMTHEISALLWRADLMSRQGELVALLSESYPFSISRELPGSVFGFSYSVPTQGNGPIAFTLYTYARTMFGNDGNSRKKILELGRRKGWDFSFYDRLTEPLATQKDGVTTSHTMFGVTVVGDAPLGINFGVNPPSEVV